MKHLVWVVGLCWFLVSCSALEYVSPPLFSSADKTTTVPMRLLRTTEIGSLPLVKVKLGQQEGWWLLDTGASANIISQSVAEVAGLVRVGSNSLSVIGGSQQQAVYQLPDMVIGNLTLGGQTAFASADLGLFSLPEGGSITGIIGMPALKQLQVKLDFPQQSLQLSQGKPLGEGNPASVVLPMGTNLGRPVVTLDLAGLGKGEFMVDTGNSGAMVMDRAAFGLEKRHPQWLTVSIDDFGGKVTTGLFLLPEFAMGGTTVKSVPVAVPLTSNTSQVLRGAMASIGTALFRTGEIILDFPDSRLEFIPEKASYTIPGGFGFLLDKNTNRVQMVIPGSPANQGGLKVGDRIVKIDGADTRNVAASILWENLADKESAKFEIFRDGKTFTLSLKRSYFLPSIAVTDKLE